MLKISAYERPGHVCIACEGVVTVDTAPAFRIAYTELVAAKQSVVIDLRKVAYVDSCGFGALIHALREQKERNGDLALVVVNESILRNLHITKYEQLFTVRRTEDDAVRAMNAHLVCV